MNGENRKNIRNNFSNLAHVFISEQVKPKINNIVPQNIINRKHVKRAHKTIDVNIYKKSDSQLKKCMTKKKVKIDQILS